MFKKITLTLATAAFVVGITAPLVMTEAEAKGFRSSSFKSSSFSRSSYRSSSSSSSSKKMFSSWGSRSSKSSSSKKSFSSTKKTKTSTSSPSKKFSSSKSAASSKFTGSKRTAGFKTVGAGKQTRKAKSALKTQRNKFKKPSTVRSTRSARSTTANYGKRASYRRAASYDSSTYYTRRNQYYGSYQPPMYVYNTSSSFGMWDTIFLYSMMSNMNNNNASRFAHNHQNDTDYQQWRREADRLSQDNAELRAQLAQLDSGKTKYKGQSVNADWIPKGIDADIAMSQEVLSAQKPTMRVCVGNKSGTYFRVTAGVLMQSINSVNIVPVTTAGTGEILDKIASGKCDAGFVQGDGYWNYVEAKQTTVLPFERLSSPYKEAVHLICNVQGPTSISELTAKNKVWFPAKSGAAETWKNFIGEDSDYGKIQTVLSNPSMNVASYGEAVMKVSNDKNSCAMYVGAVGASKFVRNIDSAAKKSNLVLVDINDNDLNDTTDPSGQAVYKFDEIDNYKQLNRNGGCYGYCSGGIESLYVNADFIVATKWKKANSKTYSSFGLDMMGVQPEIETAVRH